MSRQELAEAVNAAVFAATGKRSYLSGHYVGKLERGTHRWPVAHVRAAFRTVLGATSDAAIGLWIIRGMGNHEPELERSAQVYVLDEWRKRRQQGVREAR